MDTSLINTLKSAKVVLQFTRKVGRDQFGVKWPFSIDEGILLCQSFQIVTPDNKTTQLHAVSFVTLINGKQRHFGLNGWGMDLSGGEDIRKSFIWMLDLRPDARPGQKKDLAPLIDLGLAILTTHDNV